MQVNDPSILYIGLIVTFPAKNLNYHFNAFDHLLLYMCLKNSASVRPHALEVDFQRAKEH